MKLKFKKQLYQDIAAQSVIKCFEGQPKGNREYLYLRKKQENKIENWKQEDYEEIVCYGNNAIVLDEKELRRNIKSVQRDNGLDFTDKQGYINYSIEMETGTGKTYTYIKTMYELNQKYGWSKFIIIVPNIAIREGVLKSFQITEDHFQELYHKKIRYFIYNSKDSSNLTNINKFAEDDSIQVMIMNFQAFNTKIKAHRRIYENLDELQSRKPVEILKATNPILIIDEPQKMGKTEELLKEFNPLFILRYSATHKDKFKYNMVYRLDAVNAYNQKLVKGISVKGIEVLHNTSEDTYLYLEQVDLSSSSPTAKIEIEVKSAGGVRKVTKTCKVGDNLYEISGHLSEYKGYVVSEIDASNSDYDCVSFTNGQTIRTGQIAGDANKKYITRIQIRETIKSHFEKECEYIKRGIKVLSLFFIDEVAKYKVYDEQKKAHDGEYAKIFAEEYEQIFNEYYNSADSIYKAYLESLKGKKVHSGYFSIDKKASKGLSKDEQIFIDSSIDNKTDNISADTDAYDLIMKDKERLLSLDEPVRFIFSHSALREGWDNPNIFQICTLKNNKSEISKRQEIGRGLRICVNNNGDRMDYRELEDEFFDVNNLTVVASESYETFAKSLQSEILSSLSRKSYDIIDDSLFVNKELKNKNGESIVIDKIVYNEIFLDFAFNGYVDRQGKIQQKLREDISDNNLSIPKSLVPFEEDYTKLIEGLFTESTYDIKNANKDNIKGLKLNNDNFSKFQELWKNIKTKSTYKVAFNSNELIENAVNSLNDNLIISKLRIKITEGEQKSAMSSSSLESSDAMYIKKVQYKVYNNVATSNTKYDLIGNLATDTGLTRHTIISILKDIRKDVFDQYKYNPEEFIRQACRLINREKSKIVVKNITYVKTDKEYDDEIFTNNTLNGKLGINAMKTQKHIYDYIITDSKIEMEFAKGLEEGSEAYVYAKLPNKFKIRTPFGNYTPDWAISLNTKDMKNVCLIIGTKGSMNDSQLKGVEYGKIECAKKHFEEISNGSIKYKVIDSYEHLIDYITGVTSEDIL